MYGPLPCVHGHCRTWGCCGCVCRTTSISRRLINCLWFCMSCTSCWYSFLIRRTIGYGWSCLFGWNWEWWGWRWCIRSYFLMTAAVAVDGNSTLGHSFCLSPLILHRFNRRSGRLWKGWIFFRPPFLHKIHGSTVQPRKMPVNFSIAFVAFWYFIKRKDLQMCM